MRKGAAVAINVRLSSELKDWITHNLNRGCAPAALVDSMVGQNFDPRIARGLVDAFLTARAEGAPPPEGSVTLDGATPEYRYETPRLPAGNFVRADDRDIK